MYGKNHSSITKQNISDSTTKFLFLYKDNKYKFIDLIIQLEYEGFGKISRCGLNCILKCTSKKYANLNGKITKCRKDDIK